MHPVLKQLCTQNTQRQPSPADAIKSLVLGCVRTSEPEDILDKVDALLESYMASLATRIEQSEKEAARARYKLQAFRTSQRPPKTVSDATQTEKSYLSKTLENVGELRDLKLAADVREGKILIARLNLERTCMRYEDKRSRLTNTQEARAQTYKTQIAQERALLEREIRDEKERIEIERRGLQDRLYTELSSLRARADPLVRSLGFPMG